MKYEDAKLRCANRSAIYRTGDMWTTYTEENYNDCHPALRNKKRIGEKIRKLYWKNNTLSLDERIPDGDKKFDDWEEYDPREQSECSAYNEVPA